jgi:hypothetical protein
MDWREFVGAHAITIFLITLSLFIIVSLASTISVLARKHKLKLALSVLICVALGLAAAIVASSAGLLNWAEARNPDYTVGGLGLVLFMLLCLIWRVSNRWAAAMDEERVKSENALVEAKKQLTLRVVQDK